VNENAATPSSPHPRPARDDDSDAVDAKFTVSRPDMFMA
jgi:hypothetical protein